MHFVIGVHVVFVIILMTTKILASGWSAHRRMVIGIAVSHPAILSAPSSTERQDA
uniref:Uncharacterized protein n=1 Tax=Arundo donax TaxID=35708 RepID=A0A0A9DMK4_ARUDO